jgi:hypothetical protein
MRIKRKVGNVQIGRFYFCWRLVTARCGILYVHDENKRGRWLLKLGRSPYGG